MAKEPEKKTDDPKTDTGAKQPEPTSSDAPKKTAPTANQPAGDPADTTAGSAAGTEGDDKLVALLAICDSALQAQGKIDKILVSEEG